MTTFQSLSIFVIVYVGLTKSRWSTSHNVPLLDIAILPPPGPKMANFNISHTILCGNTELCMTVVHVQSLSIYVIAYVEPWKHYIRVQNLSSPCRRTCYCLILPPPGPKVADFNISHTILCGKTQLCMPVVPVQTLPIYVIVYVEPRKHFIRVQHLSSPCHTTNNYLYSI